MAPLFRVNAGKFSGESIGRRFLFNRSIRINKRKRARKGLEKSQRRRPGRNGWKRCKRRGRGSQGGEGEEGAIGP